MHGPHTWPGHLTNRMSGRRALNFRPRGAKASLRFARSLRPSSRSVAVKKNARTALQRVSTVLLKLSFTPSFGPRSERAFQPPPMASISPALAMSR